LRGENRKKKGDSHVKGKGRLEKSGEKGLPRHKDADASTKKKEEIRS